MNVTFKIENKSQKVVPALGREKQADLYEFEVSLVYKVSSRTVKAIQRNVLKTQNK